LTGLLDDFMLRAILAAVGTALACGALGCFVVWRRIAFLATRQRMPRSLAWPWRCCFLRLSRWVSSLLRWRWQALLAAVVAVSIKAIGALLITAMLIIPAASARLIARGPETMAAWATLTGVVAAIGGLYAARSFGTPAGPSIICFASAIFCVASVVGQLRKA
jgi:ABC-type Mn2+/Zn2+ transport system permease subunit